MLFLFFLFLSPSSLNRKEVILTTKTTAQVWMCDNNNFFSKEFKQKKKEKIFFLLGNNQSYYYKYIKFQSPVNKCKDGCMYIQTSSASKIKQWNVPFSFRSKWCLAFDLVCPRTSVSAELETFICYFIFSWDIEWNWNWFMDAG